MGVWGYGEAVRVQVCWQKRGHMWMSQMDAEVTPTLYSDECSDFQAGKDRIEWLGFRVEF